MQQSKQIKSDSVDPFTAMLATQNFRRSGSFSILDAQGLDYKQTGGQIPTPNCDKKVRTKFFAPAARNILPITPGIHNEGSFLRQTYRVASDPGFGNSARTVLSDIIETPNADMRSASEASSHWQSSIKCKFYDPNYHGAPGNCGFKKPDEKDLWRWPSEKTLVSGDTSGMGSAYHGACPQFFPVPQYSKIEGVNTGVQHCMQPSFQRSFNSTPSVDNITNTLRPNQVHSSKPWPLDYSSHLHCNRNNGGYCNSFDQQSQEQMRFLAFSQNFGISSANLSAPSNLPWIEAPGYVLPEAAQDPTDLFFLQTQLKRPSSQAFVPNPQSLSAAFGGNAQTSGFQQFANASPMTSLPTTQRALSAPTSSSEYYGPWHRKTTSQVIAENAGFNPFAAGPYTSMTTAVLVMHEQEREAQSHDRALFLAGGPNLPQALPDFSRFVWIVVLQMLGLADSSGHVRNEGSWTANAREELVVFVENVLQATDVVRSEKNLITFGFMLANKILDDHTFTNRTWSDVTKIPLEELNRYEICFMNLLNHNKFIVSRDEFLSWILALQNHFVQLTGNATGYSITPPKI
ncbi:hypothetical protein HDU82_006570 [Entophlyctis luteolus]|nr:hypothetical protein HDU82_006570 [Entophlyctis luteolus]